MKQFIGVKTVKMGLGAAIAMILAQNIGLEYAASAGIITILSIQNTRKESLEIALRRMGATLIGLSVGTLAFTLFGNHAVMFGVYLLLFIPIAVKCHVTEGIVPASVLVTHLLGADKINEGLIINEIGLMAIGVLIALVFNIYMPSMEETLMREKEHIDNLIYGILMEMRSVLRQEKEKLKVEERLKELEEELLRGKSKAHQYTNNYFFSEKSLYEKYFEMRYSQYQILLYLVSHFNRLYMLPAQAKEIAALTEEAALTIKGKVTVEEAMKTLEELRGFFKASSLPETRNEFENRAMLYQFLTDIEQFLYVKKLFKNHLSNKEIKEYSRYYHI